MSGELFMPLQLSATPPLSGTPVTGSPRLTFIGLGLGGDPAGQQQLAALARASGGRVLEAEDLASLRHAMRAGIAGSGGTVGSSSTGSGGPPRRDDTLAGWVAGALMLNVALLAALAWFRLPSLRAFVTRGPRGWLPVLCVLLSSLAATPVLSVQATAQMEASQQPSTMPPQGGAVTGVVDEGAGPVVLVHGILGNAGTFSALSDALVRRGWLELPVMRWRSGSITPDCESSQATARTLSPVLAPTLVQAPAPVCEEWVSRANKALAGRTDRQHVLVRLELIPNSGLSYQQQGDMVRRAANLTRSLTLSRHVRIMAHSMGGLAARAWMQGPDYRGEVGALMMVATPHAGSLLPYYRRVLESADAAPLRLSCRFALGPSDQRLLAKAIGLGTDFDVFSDGVARLAPDAPELIALNLGNKSSSERYGALPVGPRYVSVVASTAVQAVLPAMVAPTPGCPTEDLSRYAAAAYENVISASAEFYRSDPSTLAVTRATLANWSDLVVPVSSQYLKMVRVGWNATVEVEQITAIHTSATSDPGALETLVGLLDAPVPAAVVADESLLVLDLSGSMNDGGKLQMAKDAAKAALAALPPTSSVSLMTFGGQCDAALVGPPTTDRVQLESTVDALAAAGSTPLLGALRAATAHVARQSDARRMSVVVVSDGRETCDRRADPVQVARELGMSLRLVLEMPR
jgi:pimeloyl-ACP methyl ester carboxylesterase